MSFEITEPEGRAVPWALPNENIPIRILWPKSFVFDEIRAELADGFRCVEVVNARTVKIWKNQVDIRDTIESSVGNSNYVGLVVKSIVIQENVDQLSDIEVSFVKDGLVVRKIVVPVRTLRPKLELVKAPVKVELTSEKTSINIPLELRHSGFGDIKVNITATFRGQIISQGESLVYEMMRRLFLGRDNNESKAPGSKGEVDQNLVTNLTREIIERIESDNISLQEVDAEAIKYLKDWLADVGPDRIKQAMQARIEDVLVGMLFDLISKNPANGISLDEPRIKLVTKIQFPINQVRLDVKYRDLAGNRYPTIPVEITLEYQKAIENPIVADMPVTVTNWHQDQLMNVSEWKG